MYRPRTVAVVALAAVALSLAGCSSIKKSGPSSANPPGGSSTASAGGSTTPAVSGTVTVFAAASLTGTFKTLAKQFEAAHPGVSVKLNFGASSTLAQQIDQGAPADVFASASPKNMQQVIDAGGASASTNFVKNILEIAVPPSNPGHITALADLAKSGIKIALCQPQVPCGVVAARVFSNAKITVKPVTLEQDVKSTLTKVELNEVDAGMVYVTDVRAAGSKVKGIPIPANLNASTEYPIAALRKAGNSAGAQAFVAYVLSPAGQAVLTAAGFEQP
ncbi:MAG: molybdate ABC transporter substrate-binding protein [Pseudonocardiales bacterium]|nr:MAG: molybdate ABC transporter substrate-binding protein [Pseudonocardiales bacterium]